MGAHNTSTAGSSLPALLLSHWVCVHVVVEVTCALILSWSPRQTGRERRPAAFGFTLTYLPHQFLCMLRSLGCFAALPPTSRSLKNKALSYTPSSSFHGPGQSGWPGEWNSCTPFCVGLLVDGAKGEVKDLRKSSLKAPWRTRLLWYHLPCSFCPLLPGNLQHLLWGECTCCPLMWSSDMWLSLASGM